MHTVHTLSNGLRVMHLYCKSPIAYVGVAIDVGTRDELEDESGMAHFTEHMMFKGTRKRRAWQIINRLENVGGQMDAYTTKEDTYVYSIVPTQFVARSVELLADVVLNSTFPDEELEKERVVVLDEIDSYKDSPSELIFDEFDEHLFSSDPMGRPILGSDQSLKSFDSRRMHSFVDRCYTPDRLLLFCMGDVDGNALLRLAERHFSVPCRKSVERPAVIADSPKFDVNVKMDTNQVHCVIGTRLNSLSDKERHAAILLNNILGGPNMSSLLNMAIRERHGYCYTVESSFVWYIDTAVWTLYFGCDPENRRKAYSLAMHTLESLRHTPITPRHLAIAKRQLRGQVLIGSQNKEAVVLALSKKVLHHESVRTNDEILADIDKLTADDLMRSANTLFANLSTLTYQ